METPSSTKIVTRSQTLSARTTNTNNNNIPISRKIEDSEQGLAQSRRRNAKQQQQDRSALIDITNDSPIVGLAMETPSSAITKQRSSRAKMAQTPGSGEALLRGQVKTLLQRVEEEAELSKLSLDNRPFLHLQGFVSSPMGLLAPTPANTPQVPNLSGDGETITENSPASVTPILIVDEQLKICQVVNNIFNGKKQESLESQKSLTRSLLMDFSEKSETSDLSECSSMVTYQGVAEATSEECKDRSSSPGDDDNASIWSIQVNASTCSEEEDEEKVTEELEETEADDYNNDYYCDDSEDSSLVDELCEGILKISVTQKTMAKPTGKHTRFVYDSDGELVGEECEEVEDSSNVLRLKGLPTPKGKHLRFSSEEKDED